MVRKTPVPTFIPHTRMTLSGDFIDGTSTAFEHFTMTSSWSPGGSTIFTDAQRESVMDELVTAVTHWWTDPLNHQSNLHVIREVKLASIGVDGKYPDGHNATFRDGLDIAGGVNSSSPLPTEVALAVSLGTGLRGPRNRGRIYLPAPNIGVGPDGTMTASQVKEVATTFETDWLSGDTAHMERIASVFLAGLATAGVGSFLCIASTKGVANAVTQVRVGVVPDVIRKRRRSIKENYQTP